MSPRLHTGRAIALSLALALITPFGRLHGGAPPAGSRLPQPPNIVFILADDLGINDLHACGREDHRTPNLDRLATAGVRFTSATCAQPICSASRAALLTGLAPARLHLTTFLPGRPDTSSQRLLHPPIRQALPADARTLAEYLRDAGYATACVGKWHLGESGSGPLQRGFESYHPGKAATTPTAGEGSKGEEDLTDAAIQFVERHRTRPFFLYLAHNSPHIPFSESDEMLARHKDAFNPAYAAVIERLDTSVGRLLQRLNELGLDENTIVIFTSDNGGLHVPEGRHTRITHNAPFRAGKGFLTEGGLRVPLIVRWPGQIPAGRVLDGAFNNMDWMPTLLDLAGVAVPKGLDGQNMSSTLLKGKTGGARRQFWHFPHYTNQGGRPAGAVRDGAWKLIEQYEDGSLELYNLATDPGEKRNLVAQDPRRAAKLKRLLQTWRKSVGAQENSVNPSFDANHHNALYVAFDPAHYDPISKTPGLAERAQEWRKAMDQAVAR